MGEYAERRGAHHRRVPKHAARSADVETYFQTHNLPKSRSPASQIHVDALEFVTSAELEKRLSGAKIGIAPNASVGFASLSGSFVFTGPPIAECYRDLALSAFVAERPAGARRCAHSPS